MFLGGSLFCGCMDAAGTNSRGKACRKENTVKNRRETIQQKIPGRFSALGDLVPVAGVEPARCHHQRILSRFQQKACKCSFAFFSPFSFLNCAVKIANGQAKGEASDHAVRKKSADIFDIKSKCASGHASKCGRIVCGADKNKRVKNTLQRTIVDII